MRRSYCTTVDRVWPVEYENLARVECAAVTVQQLIEYGLSESQPGWRDPTTMKILCAEKEEKDRA